MKRAALIVLALALLGCKRQPSATVFLDPALVTLIPSDTTLLAGVRMEPLRKTPLFQRHVMPGKLPMEQSFRKETGVDIRSDIWEILVAGNGKEAIVMLRGKFTEMGMEPKLQREGLERLGYKGYTMLGDDRNAVAFLNPTTAIAGPTSALRRVIDRRNDVAGVPKVIEEKIKLIPPKNQAWIAFQGQHFGPATKLLGSIDMVWGGVDLSKGFDARLDASTPSPESAVQVRDAIKGLIGFARLQTPSGQPELLKLYDTYKVEAREKGVELTMSVPETLLEESIRVMSTVLQRGSRRPD